MTDFESLAADAVDDMAANFGGLLLSLSTGETLFLPVVDRPEMPDPTKPAQAASYVATSIFAKASEVANPRSVTRFTEAETGKWHTVIRLVPSSNPAVLQWECQRTI